MFPSTEQALDRMDEWVKITQALANAAQAIGIIVGGAWVYFKFLGGRTFARRAQVDVEATVADVAQKKVIKAKATVTNAGLSRIPFKEERKWIVLFASTVAPPRPGANVAWTQITTCDVLEDQDWVEAQESISDEVVFPFPPADKEPWRAFRLQLQVWAKPSIWPRAKHKWVDNTVVLARDESHTSSDGGS